MCCLKVFLLLYFLSQPSIGQKYVNLPSFNCCSCFFTWTYMLLLAANLTSQPCKNINVRLQYTRKELRSEYSMYNVGNESIPGTVQEKGFSPVWVTKCPFRCSARINDLSQSSWGQNHFLSPVCFCWWRFSLLAVANAQSQPYNSKIGSALLVFQCNSSFWYNFCNPVHACA